MDNSGRPPGVAEVQSPGQGPNQFHIMSTQSYQPHMGRNYGGGMGEGYYMPQPGQQVGYDPGTQNQMVPVAYRNMPQNSYPEQRMPGYNGQPQMASPVGQTMPNGPMFMKSRMVRVDGHGFTGQQQNVYHQKVTQGARPVMYGQKVVPRPGPYENCGQTMHRPAVGAGQVGNRFPNQEQGVNMMWVAQTGEEGTTDGVQQQLPNVYRPNAAAYVQVQMASPQQQQHGYPVNQPMLSPVNQGNVMTTPRLMSPNQQMHLPEHQPYPYPNNPPGNVKMGPRPQYWMSHQNQPIPSPHMQTHARFSPGQAFVSQKAMPPNRFSNQASHMAFPMSGAAGTNMMSPSPQDQQQMGMQRNVHFNHKYMQSGMAVMEPNQSYSVDNMQQPVICTPLQSPNMHSPMSDYSTGSSGTAHTPQQGQGVFFPSIAARNVGDNVTVYTMANTQSMQQSVIPSSYTPSGENAGFYRTEQAYAESYPSQTCLEQSVNCSTSQPSPTHCVNTSIDSSTAVGIGMQQSSYVSTGEGCISSLRATTQRSGSTSCSSSLSDNLVTADGTQTVSSPVVSCRQTAATLTSAGSEMSNQHARGSAQLSCSATGSHVVSTQIKVAEQHRCSSQSANPTVCAASAENLQLWHHGAGTAKANTIPSFSGTFCNLRSSLSPKEDSASSTDAKTSEFSEPTESKTRVEANSQASATSVTVPYGWKRVSENGAVIYYSPSHVRLSSTEDVCNYLQAEGTCKCGLECPLQVDKVFNFSPGVMSQDWCPDGVNSNSSLGQLCNHKRKIMAMAAFQTTAAIKSVPETLPRATDPSSLEQEGFGRKGATPRKKRKKTKSASQLGQYGLVASRFHPELTNSGERPTVEHVPGNCPAEEAPGQSSESIQRDCPSNLSETGSSASGNAAIKEESRPPCASPQFSTMPVEPISESGSSTCIGPSFQARFMNPNAGNPPRFEGPNGGYLFASHGDHQQLRMQGPPFGARNPNHFFSMQQQHTSMASRMQKPFFSGMGSMSSMGPSQPGTPHGVRSGNQLFSIQLQMQAQAHAARAGTSDTMGSPFDTASPSMCDGSSSPSRIAHIQHPGQRRMLNPQHPSPAFHNANSGFMPHSQFDGQVRSPLVNQEAVLAKSTPKPKKTKKKRSKSGEQAMLHTGSGLPCPNIDVRDFLSHQQQNMSGLLNPGPCTANPTSFLENPTAFLAQQSHLMAGRLQGTVTKEHGEVPDSSKECRNYPGHSNGSEGKSEGDSCAGVHRVAKLEVSEPPSCGQSSYSEPCENDATNGSDPKVNKNESHSDCATTATVKEEMSESLDSDCCQSDTRCSLTPKRPSSEQSERTLSSGSEQNIEACPGSIKTEPRQGSSDPDDCKPALDPSTSAAQSCSTSSGADFAGRYVGLREMLQRRDMRQDYPASNLLSAAARGKPTTGAANQTDNCSVFLGAGAAAPMPFNFLEQQQKGRPRKRGGILSDINGQPVIEGHRHTNGSGLLMLDLLHYQGGKSMCQPFMINGQPKPSGPGSVVIHHQQPASGSRKTMVEAQRNLLALDHQDIGMMPGNSPSCMQMCDRSMDEVSDVQALDGHKLTEQSPIQLVQNMVSGLGSSPSSIAAALMASHTEFSGGDGATARRRRRRSALNGLHTQELMQARAVAELTSRSQDPIHSVNAVSPGATVPVKDGLSMAMPPLSVSAVTASTNAITQVIPTPSVSQHVLNPLMAQQLNARTLPVTISCPISKGLDHPPAKEEEQDNLEVSPEDTGHIEPPGDCAAGDLAEESYSDIKDDKSVCDAVISDVPQTVLSRKKKKKKKLKKRAKKIREMTEFGSHVQEQIGVTTVDESVNQQPNVIIGDRFSGSIVANPDASFNSSTASIEQLQMVSHSEHPVEDNDELLDESAHDISLESHLSREPEEGGMSSGTVHDQSGSGDGELSLPTDMGPDGNHEQQLLLEQGQACANYIQTLSFVSNMVSIDPTTGMVQGLQIPLAAGIPSKQQELGIAGNTTDVSVSDGVTNTEDGTQMIQTVMQMQNSLLVQGVAGVAGTFLHPLQFGNTPIFPLMPLAAPEAGPMSLVQLTPENAGSTLGLVAGLGSQPETQTVTMTTQTEAVQTEESGSDLLDCGLEEHEGMIEEEELEGQELGESGDDMIESMDEKTLHEHDSCQEEVVEDIGLQGEEEEKAVEKDVCVGTKDGNESQSLTDNQAALGQNDIICDTDSYVKPEDFTTPSQCTTRSTQPEEEYSATSIETSKEEPRILPGTESQTSPVSRVLSNTGLSTASCSRKIAYVKPTQSKVVNESTVELPPPTLENIYAVRRSRGPIIPRKRRRKGMKRKRFTNRVAPMPEPASCTIPSGIDQSEDTSCSMPDLQSTADGMNDIQGSSAQHTALTTEAVGTSDSEPPSHISNTAESSASKEFKMNTESTCEVDSLSTEVTNFLPSPVRGGHLFRKKTFGVTRSKKRKQKSRLMANRRRNLVLGTEGIGLNGVLDGGGFVDKNENNILTHSEKEDATSGSINSTSPRLLRSSGRVYNLTNDDQHNVKQTYESHASNICKGTPEKGTPMPSGAGSDCDANQSSDSSHSVAVSEGDDVRHGNSPVIKCGPELSSSPETESVNCQDNFGKLLDRMDLTMRTQKAKLSAIVDGPSMRKQRSLQAELKDLLLRSAHGVKRSPDELSDDDDADSTASDYHDPMFPRTFNTGDLVWGQIRGFPSWPGKLVHENEVRGTPKTEDGKLWVRWFGDHTFTQVEPDKLKTLSEGLEAHHRARKKHRKGRKMNTNLESAIQEAMSELDRQTVEKSNPLPPPPLQPPQTLSPTPPICAMSEEEGPGSRLNKVIKTGKKKTR